MSASEPFVSLLGGLTLPLAPVLLALDLEQRGLSLTFEDNDVLIVGPRERLTNDDRTAICSSVEATPPRAPRLQRRKPGPHAMTSLTELDRVRISRAAEAGQRRAVRHHHQHRREQWLRPAAPTSTARTQPGPTIWASLRSQARRPSCRTRTSATRSEVLSMTGDSRTNRYSPGDCEPCPGKIKEFATVGARGRKTRRRVPNERGKAAERA